MLPTEGLNSSAFPKVNLMNKKAKSSPGTQCNVKQSFSNALKLQMTQK